MCEKKKQPMFDDKYQGKAIRFLDKDTHYELIFTDDFNIPSSGDWCKENTNITDILLDMRNADHKKELHIFVGSFGGYVVCLNMFLQQVMEFDFRVGINLGMACSCGFILMAACNEVYTSEYSEWMYHAMSGIHYGKVEEVKNRNEFDRQWWNLLVEQTHAHRFLTEEEIKLGETSEVWLTGKELIKRGIVFPYELYKERKNIMAANNEFFIVGDSVFRRCGDVFKKYSEDKPCKKNNQNTYRYYDLMMMTNNDVYNY